MVENFSKDVDEKFCSECGAVIKVKAGIFPRCGVRQSQPSFVSSLVAIAPNGKSKLAAAPFALFLGSLGVHKFHLGRIGGGVLYLLFCWTFIPAILGTIEGIILLVMSEADFNRKYGNV